MLIDELMIGNWVNFLGEPKQIIGVSKRLRPDVGYIEIEGHDYAHKGFHFKPIEITEKWILKFGFKVVDDGYYGLEKENGKYVFDWNVYDSTLRYLGVITPAKHVHELQNLFFTLTGNELTINNIKTK